LDVSGQKIVKFVAFRGKEQEFAVVG